MKKSRPSNSQIVDYWKDKFISSDFKIEDCYSEGSCKVIENNIIPTCFACEYPITEVVKNDDYYQLVEKNKLAKVWNLKEVKMSLEAAHVIPKSEGGTFECDNIILLCKECHRISPDIADPSYMYRYIYYAKLNQVNIWAERLKNQIKANYEMACLLGKDILDYKNIENKIDFTGVGLHGNSTSDYTRAVVIARQFDDIDFERITKQELDQQIDEYEKNGVLLAEEILYKKWLQCATRSNL